MSKQQTIKFTIKQDGTVIEEVIGSESDQCLKLTESIEKRLGEIEARELKSEFYENKQEAVTLQYNQNQD